MSNLEKNNRESHRQKDNFLFEQNSNLPRGLRMKQNPQQSIVSQFQHLNTNDEQLQGILKAQSPSKLPKICSQIQQSHKMEKYQSNSAKTSLINTKRTSKQKTISFVNSLDPTKKFQFTRSDRDFNDMKQSQRQQVQLQELPVLSKIVFNKLPNVRYKQEIVNNQYMDNQPKYQENQAMYSIQSGKLIFQLQFTRKKIQLPQQQDQQIQYNIPKTAKLTSINFKPKIRTPSPQMTPQQINSLGKQIFTILGFDLNKLQILQSIKIIKFRNCIMMNIAGSLNTLLWHYSGKLYFGGWITGQNGQGYKSGDALQYHPKKYVYKGQFFKGKKNGHGKIQYINGSIYEGQWLNGQKHGHGIFFDKQTQLYYDGEWQHNKRQGYGYLKRNNKQFYIGTFLHSIKHGHGFQVFDNGDKYKGQYSDGKFHGQGRYTWASSAYYEGKFYKGVRNGLGKWRSNKNAGQMYIGQYKSNKKCGYGRYIWENGAIYQGQFYNDLRHGNGRLINQYGIQGKGVWNKGTLSIKDDGINQQKPLKKIKFQPNFENRYKKLEQPGFVSHC